MTGPGAGAARGGRGGTIAVLRHPVYAQLLASNVVAFTGIWLYVATSAWVMLEMTGSPLMVGVVNAATFVPRVLLGLPAGALIDILDRRHLIIAGNVFQAGIAGTVGVLHATGQLGPWSLVVLTLGLGVGQSLSVPAYHSVIQDTVPRELVPAAVSLQSGAVNLALAIGPAIGGVFIAAGLTEVALLLTGTAYLALCVAAMRVPPPAATGKGREAIGAAMRTGLRFVRHSPLLVRVMLAATLFCVTSANVQTLLAPAAAARDLGAQGYGVLFGSFGVGGVLGALVGRRVSATVGRHAPPATMAVFGVAGLGFAVAASPPLAVLLVALAGAAWVVAFANLNSTVQLAAPAWVRGRVLSLHMMGLTCAMPIGALLAGGLAAQLGVARAIGLMCSVVLVVGAVTALLRLPAVEDVEPSRPPDDWAPLEHAGHVAGGPVAVLVTWTVATADVDEFLRAMAEVRRHRLRSGAVRWRLGHEPERPERFVEMFEVPDWAEHLRQAGRLDGAVAAALRRAWSLDRNGRPEVRHIVALDRGALRR